jgi:hypothetical protein
MKVCLDAAYRSDGKLDGLPVALLFLERLFNFCRLEVQSPKSRRITTAKLGRGKGDSFPPPRLTQVLPVQLATERVRGTRLVLAGQADVEDPISSRARPLSSLPQLEQQLIAGQFLQSQFVQVLDQPPQPPLLDHLFPIRRTLASGPAYAALWQLFHKFHLHRVANVRARAEPETPAPTGSVARAAFAADNAAASPRPASRPTRRPSDAACGPARCARPC